MKKFIFLLSAMSLALVSCNKEQELSNPINDIEKKTTYSGNNLSIEDIGIIHNQAMSDCLPDDDAQDAYDNLIASLDAQLYDWHSTDIVEWLDEMGYTYTYFADNTKTFGETPTELIASAPSAIQDYLTDIFDELDEATTLEDFQTALSGIKSSVIANTSLTDGEEAIVLSVIEISDASSTYWYGLSQNKTLALSARDKRVILADAEGAIQGGLTGFGLGSTAAGVGAVPGAIVGACLGASLGSATAGFLDYFGW
jgi:hypothetical protein